MDDTHHQTAATCADGLRVMLYFANCPNQPKVRAAMEIGTIGLIDTPLQGNLRPTGVTWVADNGCFNDGTFNEAKWWAWLQRQTHDIDRCVFAVAPDRYADAQGTWERSKEWLPKIRGLGFRVAFVAQDGQNEVPLRWDEFDVLFIGGTNEFKLGADVRALIGEAKERGMWVHCGRVNSFRRYSAMQQLNVDSCDGTYLVKGPDINLPKLLGWVREIKERQPLFPLEMS